MIRINLLATERSQRAEGPAVMPEAKRVTICAALLLLATVLGLGWWSWALHQQAQRLDIDVARAVLDTEQLRAVLSKIQTLEARKAQLQQRVTLLEQLRHGQTIAVRVLDAISRSVPDRLWLAEMKQAGNEVTLGGFATTLNAVPDFVASLEDTTRFRKPVEIIDSQVTSDASTGDLVRFVVTATYLDTEPPEQAAPPGPARGNN